ncbi:MAG: glycosyltransferase [Patescibacteria group bacterium]
MKRVGLFICSHDGISCRYAGVGTAASGYMKGVEKFILDNPQINLTCHAITGKYKSDSYTYNQELLNKNTEICKKTGGSVEFVLNYSDGSYQYGDINSWYVASSAAAQIISNNIIQNKYDQVVILALDTPFAWTPQIVKKQNFDFDGRIIGAWVPHSTSLIHERGDYNLDRLKWEMNVVDSVNTTTDLYVTFLNEYMKDHLRLNYGVLEGKLLPLLNGIVHSEVPRYSNNEIENTLLKYSIPTDKPLVISFGRGAKYKGFDIFLNTIKYLSDMPIHFVLQCSFFDENDPLLKNLAENAKEIPNLTFLPMFSFEFPRKLLQWKKTELCAVLSENEPGAFIPAEIRVYGQAIALVSDRDGLPCQIIHGTDGYVTSLSDPQQISEKIRMIVMMKESEKKRIRKTGQELITNEYDIVNNFCYFLDSVIT